LDMLSPNRQKIISLNPMTHIISVSRDVLIDGKLTDIRGLFYVFVVSTILFLAGYSYFRKYEDHFVEKI